MSANPWPVRDTLRLLTRNPPATQVSANPTCFAYLDASNIFLGGAAVSACRRGMAPNPKIAAESHTFDPQFRCNFTWLRHFAVGDDAEGTARAVCVGSNKFGSDGVVYRAAERAGWTAITPQRAVSGREKEVDTTLAVLLLEDVLCHPAQAGDLDITLFSGDRDLLPAVRALQRRGRAVDVVGWEHATSTELRQAARRFVALDPYFDFLSFYAPRA